MNRLSSTTKPLVAAALALGAVLAASAAHARSDVVFSIGVQAPYGYVQPAPVYVQPQPVYVQPGYGYYQGSPRSYERRGGPWGDSDRDGIANVYDRDSRFFDRRAARRAGFGDADRDGVPNRFDHAPHNPYRR
jgi:hypothetical protein